jgi:hypothetical protein
MPARASAPAVDRPPDVAAPREDASWIDRMQGAVETLPVPWWSPYVAFFVAIQVLGHLGHWLDGTIPLGELQPARNPMYGAFYPALLLGAMHWLDRDALARLTSFARAANLTADERDAAAEPLTRLPGGAVAWLTAISAVPASGVYLATSGVFDAVASSVPLVIVSVVLVAVAITSLVLFVHHALHQLGTVAHLHAAVRDPNPFDSGPLYAFAGLAARTGLVIIAVAWYGLFVRPDLVIGAGPVAIGLAAAVLASGALAAVVPLVGMHRRLATERDALRARADERVQDLVERSLERTSAEGSAGDLKDELELAVEVRRQIAGIGTWPWRPGAAAAFGSAVVLPLVIWAVTQYADRVLLR